jgi:hypothetical protein
MQNNVTLNKKSGKGTNDGVISEMTLFFGVRPGHEEELRAAVARFAEVVRKSDPQATQKTGLRDSRHAIFDNGQRLLWATTFETDWDPYLDDALILVGVEHFIDWMQHIVEAEQLVSWLQSAGGAEKLTQASTAEFEQTVRTTSAGLKAILQSVQVPAAGYWNALAAKTIPEIRKAERVEQAFQQMLDNPAAEEALMHPAMKPLLEQAAD